MGSLPVSEYGEKYVLAIQPPSLGLHLPTQFSGLEDAVFLIFLSPDSGAWLDKHFLFPSFMTLLHVGVDSYAMCCKI